MMKTHVADDDQGRNRSTPRPESIAPLLAAAFQSSRNAMLVLLDENEQIVDVNAAWCRVTGYHRDEVIGKRADDVHIWGTPAESAGFTAALRAGGEARGDVRDYPISVRRASVEDAETSLGGRPGAGPNDSSDWSGAGRTLLSAEPIRLEGTRYILVTGRDATAEIRMEQERQQARRLEELGRLAAGVAHDFNNLLMVVQGYAEFIEADAVVGRPAAPSDLAEVRRAATRAAELTRRLLAFSRERVIERQAMDLNAAVRASVGLLRPLVGETIDLGLDLAEDVPPIFADAGQFDQIVLNLATNARDAMPGGGQLVLATRHVAAPPDVVSVIIGADVAPGEYAVLEVRDSGTGMDPAAAERAFEPFFTTKAVGEGTGLGLAVVYGIVRQSGGTIRLESVLGRGTTVTLFWPCVTTALLHGAVATDHEPSAASQQLPTSSFRRTPLGYTDERAGPPRVLLVEDEAVVRSAIARILERGGYAVVEAQHGEQALALLADIGLVDLVLSDVVMPVLGGRELAERLLKTSPALPVLLMSGYSTRSDLRRGLSNVVGAIIEKPFAGAALLARVTDALADARR